MAKRAKRLTRKQKIEDARASIREIREAATRVSRIFDEGGDRAGLLDLMVLQDAGLMSKEVVENPSDTLEIGDEAWFFNDAGIEFVKKLKGCESGS